MKKKTRSKAKAYFLLASMVIGVFSSLLGGAAANAADEETQSTPPSLVNIHVHKLMYDKGTQLDVEKEGILNNGYSKDEYPSGVSAYDKATYGDVEFTLYDITKQVTPNKDSQMTDEKVREIIADVDTKGVESDYIKNASNPVTGSVDLDGNVSWKNQKAYKDGQRTVYLVYETKTPKGLINQKAQAMVFAAPFTTTDGKRFLREAHLYPKNITQKLDFVLTKLGDDGTPAVNASELAGAKFSIYKGQPGKGTKLGDLEADHDGTLTATNLTMGSYYFVENPSAVVADPAAGTTEEGQYLLGADARNDANNKLTFEITAEGVEPSSLKLSYINYLPPTAKKEVLNGVGDPDKSYSVGQLVKYKGTIHIPNDVSGGKKGIDKNGDLSETQPYGVLNWKDTAGKGLTYVSSKADIKVVGDDKALTAGTDYFLTETDKGFTVDFIVENKKVSPTVAALAGKDVTIEYNMLVNQEAVIADELLNSFDLSYCNNPYADSDQEIKHITGKVPVFTYGAKFIKVDSGLFGTGIGKTPLSGAEFVVLNNSGKFFGGLADTDSDGVQEVQWVANEDEAEIITSDSKGFFEIKGLHQGDYVLQEQKAPEGYQKMTENVPFKVTKDSYKDENRIDIENDQRGVMPRTGSQQTLLYAIIAGAVAVIGVAGFFIYKKRIA